MSYRVEYYRVSLACQDNFVFTTLKLSLSQHWFNIIFFPHYAMSSSIRGNERTNANKQSFKIVTCSNTSVTQPWNICQNFDHIL